MLRFTGSLLSFITPRCFIKSYCMLCTNCSLRKQLLMSLGWGFQFSYYTSLFLWSPGRDWLDASWRCSSCVLFFFSCILQGSNMNCALQYLKKACISFAFRVLSFGTYITLNSRGWLPVPMISSPVSHSACWGFPWAWERSQGEGLSQRCVLVVLLDCDRDSQV